MERGSRVGGSRDIWFFDFLVSCQKNTGPGVATLCFDPLVFRRLVLWLLGIAMFTISFGSSTLQRILWRAKRYSKWSNRLNANKSSRNQRVANAC